MFNLIIILMTEFEEKFRQSEIFRISDYDFLLFMNRATATPVSVPIILNINKNVTRLSNYGMYLFHFSLIK